MTLRLAERLPPLLLGLGPFLAGAAGFGFFTVPLFAAIALVWLGVRAGDPTGALCRGRVPGRVLVVLAQAGIAALALMLGRGVAGLAGIAPGVPLLVPVFLSLLALAVERRLAPGPAGLAARTAATLAGLPPGGVSARAIAPILDAAIREGQGLALLAALEAPPGGGAAVRRARALHALRPEVAPFLIGTGRAGRAVGAALDAADPGFLRELAQALATRRADLPALAAELPDPGELARMAARIEAEELRAAGPSRPTVRAPQAGTGPRAPADAA